MDAPRGRAEGRQEVTPVSYLPSRGWAVGPVMGPPKGGAAGWSPRARDVDGKARPGRVGRARWEPPHFLLSASYPASSSTLPPRSYAPPQLRSPPNHLPGKAASAPSPGPHRRGCTLRRGTAPALAGWGGHGPAGQSHLGNCEDAREGSSQRASTRPGLLVPGKQLESRPGPPLLPECKVRWDSRPCLSSGDPLACCPGANPQYCAWEVGRRHVR